MAYWPHISSLPNADGRQPRGRGTIRILDANHRGAKGYRLSACREHRILSSALPDLCSGQPSPSAQTIGSSSCPQWKAYSVCCVLHGERVNWRVYLNSQPTCKLTTKVKTGSAGFRVIKLGRLQVPAESRAQYDLRTVSGNHGSYSLMPAGGPR